MNRNQCLRCEVCGIQESDHSKWLLVSDEPCAQNIDILEWDDTLAEQAGICRLCCSDHMQVLVGMWMMSDLGILPQPEKASAQVFDA